MKKGAIWQIEPFQNKEKGDICQMVHFVTQSCIVVIILVNAKCIICHVTPVNSKQL